MFSGTIFRVSVFAFVFITAMVVLLSAWNKKMGQEHEVRINGVFVLVDQQELMEKVKRIDAESRDKAQFISQVEHLLSREPYIQSSTLRYSWPNQVVIDIHEITPIALIGGQGYVTSNCKIISSAKTPVTGIPVFEIEGDALDRHSCNKIQEIRPYLGKGVRSVAIMSNGDYKLDVYSRRYVISDDLQTMFEKIRRIERQLNQMNMTEFMTVDLRYSSGSAVRVVAQS